MSNSALNWIIRLRNVEREHEAACLAVKHFLRLLHEGQVTLEANLKRVNVSQLAAKLEETYIIRLFSEFELGLKIYLKEKKERIPREAKPLINRVASKAGFKGNPVTNAHSVRRYRNKVVHHLEDKLGPLLLRKATSFLCTFLDRLRKEW